VIINRSALVAIAFRTPEAATARLADEPLLYVGTDFAATDLQTA
jgi:hypothetical protein